MPAQPPNTGASRVRAPNTGTGPSTRGKGPSCAIVPIPAERAWDHLSERDWQAWVEREAERHGWDWWHDTDSRRNKAGLPDLVLWRHRVLWAELKTATGRLTPRQRATIDALRAAGAAVYVWRPADRAEVARVLAGEEAP